MLHTVYPDLFPSRRIKKGSDNANLVPVRSYEDFLQYLLDKDSGFKIASLPFDGKNRVIYKIVS